MTAATKKKTAKQPSPYRWPLWFLGLGAIVPIVLSLAVVYLVPRPQCPSYVTQEYLDTHSCIIGADMSIIWVLFALLLAVLVAAISVVWILIVWRRAKRHG